MIFWPISRKSHYWPEFFISYFKNAGIIQLISTMLIKSLIPELVFFLFCFFFFWFYFVFVFVCVFFFCLLNCSMCKIQHFLSAKRSFENLHGMIGRIFLITNFIFTIWHRIEQNLLSLWNIESCKRSFHLVARAHLLDCSFFQHDVKCLIFDMTKMSN